MVNWMLALLVFSNEITKTLLAPLAAPLGMVKVNDSISVEVGLANKVYWVAVIVCPPMVMMLLAAALEKPKPKTVMVVPALPLVGLTRLINGDDCVAIEASNPAVPVSSSDPHPIPNKRKQIRK